MQPFWLVRRLTDSALKALKEKEKDKRLNFNATITEQEFQSMCMGAWHDESVSLVYKVVVPVLTNTVSLQVNDELILQKAEPKEQEGKARTEDWKPASRDASRRPERPQLRPRPRLRQTSSTSDRP